MNYYPENNLNKFEFDHLKGIISDYCQTAMGKSIALALLPYSKYSTIKRHLELTDELVRLSRKNNELPTGAVDSAQSFLNYLQTEGSTGSVDQFMIIKQLASTVSGYRKFINSRKEDSEFDSPQLTDLILKTPYEKEILEDINQIFTQNGLIKDNASSVLAVIREESDLAKKELNRQFKQDLRRYQQLGYLADVQESIRNGRRVLAVKAEYKRKVNGVIHDISESGQTAYIEPNDSMQFANEVANLEQEERAEINRILKELTNTIRPYIPVIEGYETLIGRIDFTKAKAKLSIKLDSCVPHFQDNTIIHLVKAFHPILKLQNDRLGKKTNPISINLDQDQRIIVISGPNAGGKSVALKTIGLLQLMIQSGIPVPVDSSSKMGMFDLLLAEIGDEQSIENELSTYSSKLQHMTYFLSHANSKTLFLIDEFGSGTDPNLGGAVAQAILEDLNYKKSFGVVTTHYLNLKVYAENTPGIVNGAMLFDEQSLKPLYQLETGKPGSSYTFAIAQTSGLPSQTVERAKSISSESQVELEDLLNNTQQSQSELFIQQLELDNQKRELDQQQVELNKIKEQLKNQKASYKVSKKEEEIRIKSEVKKQFDQYVKQLQTVDNKDKAIQHIRANLKNELDSAQSIAQSNRRELVESKNESKAIHVGDQVEWITTNQVGQVLEIKNNKAEVALGNLKTTIPLSDLVNTKRSVAKQSRTISKQTSSSKPIPESFHYELDIRGDRYEDARLKLVEFFDQAVLNNAHWVKVLHGKGSGVLRNLTQEVAKDYHAKSIKHPHFEEGGDGISIIEF